MSQTRCNEPLLSTAAQRTMLCYVLCCIPQRSPNNMGFSTITQCTDFLRPYPPPRDGECEAPFASHQISIFLTADLK